MNLKSYLNIILSLTLLFPNISLAEILADTNAPKSNQPTILKTPNNAIQVDIVKPNNKGVSINEYSKFNTTDKGTILNNSRNEADTITGSYIHANPRLSEGSAKLIVNKINSNKKSSLKGNIEIAGDKADLMIANPSGIDIDGVHFINSKSTTLTSAELKFKDGALNNIDVKQGEISISNRGLKDESNYLNIISKTAKISANVYANNLNIITGKNRLDKDLNILSSSSDDTKISIDTSNLGGMYANRIKLIATNKGIGVNNNAKIVANNDISINLNGDLINKADLISNDNINIKAKDIKNSGRMVANSSLNLKAEKIDNNFLLSCALLNIKSKNLNNKSNIESIKLNLNTDFLSNQGLIYAYDLATINSENFINKGQIYTNSLEIYNSYDFINLNSVLNAKNHLEIYTNNLISKNSDFLSKSGAILSNNTKLIHSNLNNVNIYTKLFFNKNSKFQNLNIINQILKTDSDLFANIFQSNLNIKEKEKILSEFITSYAKNLGYFNYINVVLLNTYQDGANNSQFLGNFNTNTPNTIYVNLAYINNPIKLTNALGHELYHLISFSRHSFIANDKSQDIEANKQGYLLSYYLNENLKTKRPLYKYQNIKTAHSDKQILDNEEFFKELDKYNSDNAAPIVVPLGMQVLKSTFKSSFVKKITNEQIDRLTKAIIIKCINCHGTDVYKTGKKFDTDLTNALDKKGYHNKFLQRNFLNLQELNLIIAI